MEEINGCLGVGEKNSDFLIEGFEDSLPNLYEQDNIIYEYNQFDNEWSKKSCTIFSAIGAISDLFNYEFSEKEIKEIDSLSYEKGRMQNKGWWVQSAVKLVADWWNSNEKLVKKFGKVAYYMIDLTNDMLVDNILSKLYTIMTNYNGNCKYTLDYLKDAVLNGTDFGVSTYGHAVNIRKVNGKRCVKDSQKGRKTNNGKLDCNIYELEHKLSEIKCYSTNGYIYTKVAEDKLEEIKRLNNIKSECSVLIEHLGSLYHLVNDSNFQGVLHYTAEKLRGKVADANEQLAKYQ